jgi:hypothetical protein
MGDNGEFLPQQSIEEGGLTRIGTANNGDESGTKGHYLSLCAVARVRILLACWEWIGFRYFWTYRQQYQWGGGLDTLVCSPGIGFEIALSLRGRPGFVWHSRCAEKKGKVGTRIHPATCNRTLIRR